MGAAAKGHVGLVLAADVELVRGLEHLRVAIGGAQGEGHGLALFHRAAADLHVGRGDAAGDVHRRLIAQGLLDHGVDQGGVGLELGQLVGIEQQQAYGVADQVGGGQVAADQKGAEIDAQLHIAQGRALGLEPGHVRDQVVAGFGPPRLDGLGEIGGQSLAGPFHMGGLFGVAEWVQPLDHAFGPVAELHQPVAVDAQDRGDGVDGHRHAEAAHQVEGLRPL